MSSNDILILVVEDITKGELLNEIIDTDVKKLPDLAISRIVWVDDKDLVQKVMKFFHLVMAL